MARGVPRRGPDELSRLMVEIRGSLSQRGAAWETSKYLPGDRRISQSKISRAEEGRSPLDPVEADAFARACNAKPAQRHRLVELAHAAARPASRAAVARNAVLVQNRIARLERDAPIIRAWQDNLILGELQTPAYREGVVGTEPGERWLEARAARDRQFREGDQEWHLLMYEGALRWPLISYAVMADQMDHLIAVSQLPRVTLGMLDQQAVKPSPAPPSSFHIYGDTAAITATAQGATFWTVAQDVRTYREMFADLERVAVFGDDARGILARVADDYRNLGE